MKEKLGDKIYKSLRDDIFAGRIGSRDVLTESLLAQKYGVSKAPVRDALHSLCHEGYLVSYPRKGYMLNDMDYEECVLMQQFRFHVESAVIRAVVQKCSDEEISGLYELAGPPSAPKEKDPHKSVNALFHARLAALTGNHYFTDTVEAHVSAVTRTVLRFPIPYKDKLEDHRAIVDSLLARDAERAIELLYEDLSSVFEFER